MSNKRISNDERRERNYGGRASQRGTALSAVIKWNID
jgi:hypothetical protein